MRQSKWKPDEIQGPNKITIFIWNIVYKALTSTANCLKSINYSFIRFSLRVTKVALYIFFIALYAECDAARYVDRYVDR